MEMTIKILNEQGYFEALFGLGQSYGLTSGMEYETFLNMEEEALSALNRLDTTSDKLAPLGNGHNKFLESMIVWLDIKASRGWWQEFDTYRVGMTKQSESTMHTIKKRPLTKNDFIDDSVDECILERLNEIIQTGDLNKIKRNLPEGFLQRRIVCTNYKVLQNMVRQRKNHKLVEWRTFLDTLKNQLLYPSYIFS